MQRYGGRPHWGKIHFQGEHTLRGLYPEWERFQAVRRASRPRAALRQSTSNPRTWKTVRRRRPLQIFFTGQRYPLIPAAQGAPAMRRLLSTRYGAVWLFIAIFLALQTLVRTVLVAASWQAFDPSSRCLARIYGAGLSADVVTVLYAVAPFALYASIVPDRVWRSRPHRFVLHGLWILASFVLLFAATAEWLLLAGVRVALQLHRSRLPGLHTGGHRQHPRIVSCRGACSPRCWASRPSRGFRCEVSLSRASPPRAASGTRLLTSAVLVAIRRCRVLADRSHESTNRHGSLRD